jgi:hypothetical protein
MARTPIGHEATLYDQEAAEAEDMAENDLKIEGETEPHTNGASPAYVETADEDELRSLIFTTSDVVEELLDIPEWKKDGRVVQVLVRSLSARERTQYLNAMASGKDFDLTKAYPDLVILSARHPVTKKLLFKPADRNALLQKGGRAIERIAMRAGEISGLSEDAIKEMKKK